MALITAVYVKENFPLWDQYCTDDTGAVSETILQKEIDLSIIKFSEYLSLTDEEITEPLRLHLLNIVQKRCWQRRHGDTEFKEDPQLIKDYKETIKTLTGYKEGTLSLDPATITAPKNTVIITAKPRRFGGLFFDEDYYNG